MRHSDEPTRTQAVPPGGIPNQFNPLNQQMKPTERRQSKPNNNNNATSGGNSQAPNAQQATTSQPFGGSGGSTVLPSGTTTTHTGCCNQIYSQLTRRQTSTEQQQQVYMKSCLSDGDFHEILIKVSGQDDADSSPRHSLACDTMDNANVTITHQTGNSSRPSHSPDNKSRRRSSCSDADEPKMMINHQN